MLVDHLNVSKLDENRKQNFVSSKKFMVNRRNNKWFELKACFITNFTDKISAQKICPKAGGSQSVLKYDKRTTSF